MAALTEVSAKLTELGGEYQMFCAKLDGTTATNGTLTVSEFTGIASVVATLAAAATADCCGVAVTDVTTNVITFQLQEADGTICTQNPLDFYVQVIGYQQNA
jgi:hypothetical protein